jgi:hypothetical protein
MRAALADFESGIDKLLEFLSRSEAEQELISLLHARRDTLPPDEAKLLAKVVAGSTNSRQYVYAVAVVSLYGLLERLVDALVQSAVARFADLSPTVDDLPEAIRKNHFQFSLDLLTSLERDKYRTDLSIEVMAENLHICLAKRRPYRLNTAAFAMHRGNVTLNRISEILKGIGLQQHLIRISRVPAFVRYIKVVEPERDVHALQEPDIRVLLEPVDDLVRRRNDVSHGVILADDIQAILLLRDRSELVRTYGLALGQVLQHETVRHAVQTGNAVGLGKPIEVYNHQIVCFESDQSFAVGDELVAVTGDAAEPIRSGQISRIEIDGAERERVVGGSSVKLALQVMFRAKRTHDYYLLPRK